MDLFKTVSLVTALSVFAAVPAMAGFTKKPTEHEFNKSVEHQTKGSLLDELGNSKDALEEYREALNYDPDDTNTLFDMGTVYLKINRPAEAVKVFEYLIKIDSKDTEAYNLLGLAYRGCGKKQEAINAWEKSLSIDPTQTMPRKFIEEAKAL